MAYAMIRLMADGTKIRATDFVTNTGWGLPTILAFSNSCSCYLRSFDWTSSFTYTRVQLAVVTIAAVIAIENLLLRNPPLMGDGSISVNPTPEPYWLVSTLEDLIRILLETIIGNSVYSSSSLQPY